ncbi:hypothetical protein OSB04_013931 [Centaurea solstitialis]|uniref:Uncharacterized protein n=1 Tax=Centaurea solstitialis TaxID=347529 RepID=A0AA38TX81_9ASTR|nr:hypothetical protein OSB04_013931 [Centaurea solstitialis]
MVPDADQIMTWVKWYVTVASLLCIFAMAADVFQSFRSSKLWFPCRYFTINSTSISLITITMKLLIDMTSGWPGMVKVINLIFLFTMLANFLPSLGGMNDKELFTNITALGILITTIILKLYVQEATYGKLFAFIEMSIVLFFLLWPFCVALIVPTSRKVLEAHYQKLHNHQEKNFSSEGLHVVLKSIGSWRKLVTPSLRLLVHPSVLLLGWYAQYLLLSHFFSW